MSLNCEVNIPDVPGLKPQQLTVGRHFNLLCKGEIPTGFDLSKAQLSEAHKYEFVLFKLEKEGLQLKLDLVSYLTGELPSRELTLSDGTQSLTAGFSSVKVDSVLPPPEKTQEGTEKPPEPFGYVVSSLNWPVGYTIVFIILFCATLALLIQQMLKRQRVRRLLQQMDDYHSATAPDSQFYKTLRQLEKQNYPIQDIEQQFRLYIIRRYQVPLFGLSLNESMRFLKKKWPTLIQERRDLKNILLDLKKMNEKSDPEENKKYLKKLYQFVDHSEDVLEKIS